MKKIVKYIFCAVLTLSICGTLVYNQINGITSAKKLKAQKTIIIDAGHGGFDGGAVANDGTNEKDINLQIALKLGKIMELYGFNTVYTRTSDIALGGTAQSSKSTKRADLNERVNIIKKYPESIFISIHQNKFGQESVNGLQVFYKSGSEPSKLIADSIQNSVELNLQKQNKRQAKSDTRKIFVLENSPVSAVIVECGFLSNYSDLKNLKSEEYQSSLAFCIASGILNSFNENEGENNGTES